MNPRYLFLLFTPAVLAQNVITTLAGSRQLFPAGGAPAMATSIAPSRLAASPNGEIYFGDREANVVLKLADGTLTVVAGNGQAGYSGDGGPATAASLNQPSGLALDSQGNLYIADARNACVRKVDSQGIITTVAGNGHPGYSGDGGPAPSASLGWSGRTTFTTNGGHVPAQYAGGVAVDRNSNLYIADFENNRVRRVGADGVITTVAGNGSTQTSGDGGPATSAGIAGPTQVALDSQGNLFIATSREVRRVNADGTIVAELQRTGVTALAVDGHDTVYASAMSPGQIIAFSAGVAPRTVAGSTSAPAGERGFGVFYFGDGGPATSAGLAFPFGVTADGAGNIFIADTFNERIRKIDTKGVITTMAGTGAPNFFGDGGAAAGAGLSLAKLLVSGSNLAVDSSGLLYIADTTNGRIRRVDQNGIITTFADFTGAASPGIRNPYSLAVAKDGSILAAEFGVPIIVSIGADGKMRTIAGAGSASPDNGVAAANAKFAGVNGLAADRAGNIYLLDGITLRRIDAQGILRGFGSNLTGEAVAVDNNGNVLLASARASLTRIAPDGSRATIPLAEASQITGIAADSSGNIYLSDSGNHGQILRVAPDGSVTAYAGNNTYSYSGDGGLATEAGLWGPTGLAVDAAGNLYIADTFNDRIREVMASAVAWSVSPSQLSFAAIAGAAGAGTQTIKLSPGVAGVGFVVSTSDRWLAVGAAAAVMPAALQVTVNPGSLAPGTYTGTVTISSPLADPPAQTVAVTLALAPPSAPKLGAEPQAVTLSVPEQSAPAQQTLFISNRGSGILTFDASASSDQGWLHASIANGTAVPAIPGTIALVADPAGLAPGSYAGSVGVASPTTGEALNIPVTLTVTASNRARILLSQTGLSFRGAANSCTGNAPCTEDFPQCFAVLNSGQGTLDFTVSTDVPWLLVGRASCPYRAVSSLSPIPEVVAQLRIGSMTPGAYEGHIVIASPQADNSPQQVTVKLTVLPANTAATLEVRPTGIVFSGPATQTPGSLDVYIYNFGRQGFHYNSSSVTVDGGSWFSYTPAAGDVKASQNSSVLRVFPDFSGISPGTYHGGITLATNYGLQPVDVLAAVTGAAPAAAQSRRAASDACVPAQLDSIFTLVEPEFTARAGEPFPLEVYVSDNCGNPLTAGTVLASFTNGDEAVALTSLQDGRWAGTWMPSHADSGRIEITVRAGTPDSSLTGEVQRGGNLQ